MTHTKDNALRLALDALHGLYDGQSNVARKAIKEALAQPAQEPVAYPEGNVVAHCICGSWPGGKCRKCPKQPAQEIDAVYGYCPTCGAKGVSRERHPDGSDICTSGHTYKSKDALATPQQPAPAQEVVPPYTISLQKQKWAPLTDAERRSYQKGHDAGVAHHKQAIGQRNFCHRCGKRLQGVLGQPQVHTCTPPLWGYK